MTSGLEDVTAGIDVDLAREGDARSFLQLCEALDRETDFMLFEPGERSLSEDSQKQAFACMFEANRRLVLVARLGGQVAGFAGMTAGAFRRNRHVASLILGVRRSLWGHGIGKVLLKRSLDSARTHSISRLDLTVRNDNLRALRLYLSAGFSIEGTRKHSLLISGRYYDELYMGITLADTKAPT